LYPLACFGHPLGSVWAVSPLCSAVLWRWCCRSSLSALLGFVMSSFSSIPTALIDLRREVMALELEARDLRSWGRPALAISVEREMRVAQERFEKAALAYIKLGLV